MTDMPTPDITLTSELPLPAVRLEPRQLVMRAVAVLWLASMVAGAFLAVPGALRYQRSSSLTWLDGKVAADFEHFVTQAHPLRDPALNAWAAFELSAFGEGRPGVVVGRDGWLYTREEFPLPSALATTRARNLDRIAQLSQALQARGIRVLIVPVPAKADIYPEHVPPALAGRAIIAPALTAALAQRQLPYVDTVTALRAAKAAGQQVFFRTETHWTPAGAEAAARAVADRAHALGLVSTTAFHTQRVGSRPLESDLENFLPLAPHYRQLLPAPERYDVFRTLSEQVADSSEALFGATARPVVLVGTSYSADGRWHFANWLRQYLGTDLDNVSAKAQGPFAPMQTFLHRLDAGELAPELVLWEIPVRSITVDYDRLNQSPRKH